jgi:acetylornithine deacetylase
MIAFLELVDELEDGEVSLLFDVGEEYGGDGIRYVENEVDYHWETVIFGEPTELKLGVGHKGGYGGVINVTGLASHSGYPELGIDANSILIDVLTKLKNLDLPSDELLGNSSLNIGLIEGGVAGNVISPHASASLLFRVTGALDQFPSLVKQAIKETEYASHVDYVEYEFKEGPVFFEYQIPGFQSIVLGYGTNAFTLKKNKIPHKILYGPGTIHVAHGPNEHVTTDDLIEAVQGYKKLIKWSLEQ